MPHIPDFRFSSQSLQDYVECQRRFALRYLQRLDWPAEESSPYLAFEHHRQKGNLFHTCVERYFHQVDPALIEKHIADDDLRDWWQRFLRFMDGKKITFSAPEILFQTSLRDHVLIAKFDLLVKNDENTFTIYDWKTIAGEKRPTRAVLAEKMQTLVYPYVLCASATPEGDWQKISPAQVELIYWFPQFPTDPEKFAYSSVQMQENEKVLLALMDEIAQKSKDDFPKTEDEKRCRFCVYRSYCGRGSQAGSFSGRDEEFDLELEELDLDIETAEEIAY